MKARSSVIKKNKIRFALFLVLFVGSLFALILTTSYMQLRQATYMTASIAGMPVLQQVALLIDGDKYERLVQTLDDTDPFYIETNKKFREIKASTQCLYLYAMAPRTDDVHIFIFDAEDPDSEQFSPLGAAEELSDYNRSYWRVYETKTQQFTPTTSQTKWGRLISAYAPILNSSGDVVGVIGVDFPGESIYEAIMSKIWLQIGFAAIITMIGLYFYYYILKVMALQNEALSEMSRRAEVASQAKSDFLARMSHEIRTPMNAVLGMSELARRDYGTPKGLEYLSGIKSAGMSLLSIINDILDLSKIESGRLNLTASPYETTSLQNEVLAIIRIRIEEKPIELVVEADPSVPGKMTGDSERIKQVLLNLLSNAVKYTDKGFIRFSFSGQREGNNAIRLTFVIADSGIGIRTDDLHKLFGDFVRVDEKRNNAIEGTGLGLPIARSLCRAMGGDITVASEYGKGSTFTATLIQAVSDWTPMGSPINTEVEVYAETQRASFMAPEAGVLVADDFSSNLMVAEGLLAPYKMRICTCLNGREAVELVQARSFDLVLMDHMMPEMDGMEAVAAIRALGGRFAELPIVALTANVVSGMKEQCLAGGFNDFLAKPIDTMELDALLQKWIPAEKQTNLDDNVSTGSKLQTPHSTLLEIEGVDIVAGMARVGGQPVRYRELLRIFRKDVGAGLALLDVVPDSLSLPSFTTFVHALKSGLANIGAEALSKSAATLEQAGRNGDMVVIQSNLAPFRDGLAKLMERIGEI